MRVTVHIIHADNEHATQSLGCVAAVEIWERIGQSLQQYGPALVGVTVIAGPEEQAIVDPLTDHFYKRTVIPISGSAPARFVVRQMTMEDDGAIVLTFELARLR